MNNKPLKMPKGLPEQILKDDYDFEIDGYDNFELLTIRELIAKVLAGRNDQ